MSLFSRTNFWCSNTNVSKEKSLEYCTDHTFALQHQKLVPNKNSLVELGSKKQCIRTKYFCLLDWSTSFLCLFSNTNFWFQKPVFSSFFIEMLSNCNNQYPSLIAPKDGVRLDFFGLIWQLQAKY